MPDVSFGAVSLQLRTLSRAGLVDVRISDAPPYWHGVGSERRVHSHGRGF